MIVLDYSDKRPIYEQVADRLQTLIISGALEPDSKLPSVRAMAIDLSINPNTIQRAYTELERDGFIYTIKGQGSFVKADPDRITKHRNKSLQELKVKVIACKDQDISKDEILSCVNSVYEEVSA